MAPFPPRQPVRLNTSQQRRPRRDRYDPRDDSAVCDEPFEELFWRQAGPVAAEGEADAEHRAGERGRSEDDEKGENGS